MAKDGGRDKYSLIFDIAKALVLIIAGEYIKDTKAKSDEK